VSAGERPATAVPLRDRSSPGGATGRIFRRPSAVQFASDQRCPWARNELLIRYHDEEWGVPQHDDRVLFEHLVLSGAQAGLSWSTILARREGYQVAFDGFDPARVARYNQRKFMRL